MHHNKSILHLMLVNCHLAVYNTNYCQIYLYVYNYFISNTLFTQTIKFVGLIYLYRLLYNVVTHSKIMQFRAIKKFKIKNKKVPDHNTFRKRNHLCICLFQDMCVTAAICLWFSAACWQNIHLIHFTESFGF